jgi:hypothetical protein
MSLLETMRADCRKAAWASRDSAVCALAQALQPVTIKAVSTARRLVIETRMAESSLASACPLMALLLCPQ